MDKEDCGHYVCYESKNFRPETLATMKLANDIIAKYEGAGMPMSLRQLYYQMVAKNMIPNSDQSYDRLKGIIGDGRMGGLVSWTAIEDRGRNLMGLRTQTSPQGAVKAVLADYRLDLWADQPIRPEVWVEKAALEGVIGTICDELRVDFLACRGYNSLSEKWRAGRRFARYLAKGQRPIVFHLGDHDPSGIDMTRDNKDRLAMFTGVPVQVVRLALNMSQIEQYNPPPNPAKEKDVRYAGYAAKYSESSWELDALEPTVIHELIRDAVARIRDEARWDEALKREVEDKLELESMIEESGGEDDGSITE